MQLKPWEKYFPDCHEASEYYGFGMKKARRIAEDGLGIYAVRNGDRIIIVMHKFQEFIEETMLSGVPGNLSPTGETARCSQDP